MIEHSLSILEFQKIKQILSNFTLTDIGKQYIDDLEPLSSIETVQLHWNLIDDIKKFLVASKPPKLILHNIFSYLDNVHIESFFLSQKQIFDIKVTLDNALKFNSIFSDKKKSLPYLYQISKKIKEILPLQEQLNKTFSDIGEINDNASPELNDIRLQITRLSDSIHKSLNQIIDKNSMFLEEKNYILSDNRFLLLVKSQFKNKIKGFVHSKSSSGRSLYIEPEKIISLNNSFVEYKRDEETAIYHILLSLTKSIGLSVKEIFTNLHFAGLLDASFAKYFYAEKTNSHRPKFNSKKEIFFPKARHPLIDNCIPFDIKITPPHLVLIISGPNTGGKTISLKTTGLLVLMALSGMFIPTNENATLPFFDNVFIDLGDEQSIESALSTFSAHIFNIKKIIETMTQNSLVLIDEPGTGTEPEFGSIFAESLLETLIEKNVLSLITTHYQNIKTLALHNSSYQNASVAFDEKTLKPLYSLIYDIPGDSQPFPTLKRLQFPDDVLKKIKTKLQSIQSHDVSVLMKNLMAEKLNLETKTSLLENEKTIFHDRLQKFQEKETQVLNKEKNLKKTAFKEIQSFLKEKRSQFERLVKLLSEQGKSKTIIKETHSLFKNIEKEAEALLDSKEIENSSEDIFYEGEIVQIKNQNYTGKIRNIQGDQVELETPIGITRISKSKLKKQKTNLSPQVSIAVEKKEAIKSSLDIRGLYQKEAKQTLLQYYDSVLLSNLPYFKIIHGKGGGKLKQLVQTFLKDKLEKKEIRNFHYASPQDGGDGCTIIEM